MSFADEFRRAFFGAAAPRGVRVINTRKCVDCGVYVAANIECNCRRPLLTEGTALSENIWPLELGGEA